VLPDNKKIGWERMFAMATLLIIGLLLVFVSVTTAVFLGGMFYTISKSVALSLVIGVWSYVCSLVVRREVLAALDRWLLPREEKK
jgi:hypothetical protein